MPVDREASNSADRSRSLSAEIRSIFETTVLFRGSIRSHFIMLAEKDAALLRLLYSLYDEPFGPKNSRCLGTLLECCLQKS